MAQKFNIVAQLNLQGPTNVKAVVNDIKRQLSGVNANVNVQLDKRAVSSINEASKKLSSLGTSAKKSTDSLNKLNKANKSTGQGMANTARNMNEAATAAHNFGKQSQLAVKRFAAFTVGAGIIGGFVTAIKKGTVAAIEFEREMVKVAQVTGQAMNSLGGVQ